MSYVEIETGRYVKRWAFWNPATWSIPKLYWDAWSQEQRIHAICRQLEKVIKYADYLGVNTDDIAARLKAIEDGQLDELITAKIEEWFEENEPEIIQAIEALQDSVGDLEDEINTIKSDGWVTTPRIENNAVTNDKLSEELQTFVEESEDNIEKLISVSKLGKTINPLYVGILPTEPSNLGCVCRNQNLMVCVSTDEMTLAGGTIRVYDIDANLQLYKRDSVIVGHANSICYDFNTNYYYLAPMRQYTSGGDYTYINKLYKYNYDFTQYTEITTPEMIWGVSFDPITEQMWAFAKNDNQYATFYKVTNDEFEMFGRIAFTEINAMMQDIAVSNDVCYLAMPDGNLLVIPLDGETLHIKQTAFISNLDAGNWWYYGEVEGIEFDSENRLYNARLNYDGAKTASEPMNYRTGFVTEINFENHHREAWSHQSFGDTFTIMPSNQRESIFRPDALKLKSIHNVNWLMPNIKRIQYSSDPNGTETTFNEGAIRFARNDDISITIWDNCVVNIDHIESDGGLLGIQVAPNGTLNCLCDSTTDFIASTNSFTVFSFRNRGTVNIESGKRLFSSYYFPCLSIITGLGNLSVIRINDNTSQITGAGMVIGNYFYPAS